MFMCDKFQSIDCLNERIFELEKENVRITELSITYKNEVRNGLLILL
jgi:hypothetical protein